jgi:hypothetical protein
LWQKISPAQKKLIVALPLVLIGAPLMIANQGGGSEAPIWMWGVFLPGVALFVWGRIEANRLAHKLSYKVVYDAKQIAAIAAIRRGGRRNDSRGPGCRAVETLRRAGSLIQL